MRQTLDNVGLSGYRHPNAGGSSDIKILTNMKINSPLGKMKGKLGNIVISSVGGEVIGREYNPDVTNPNTESQQKTRAKFKIASQLSAALAEVIAIKKDGNVSARNQFTSINFDSIRYTDGVANINLNTVQLTKSNKAFAGFNADRSAGSAIAVSLNADSAAAISRVVYICYKKNDDGSLQLSDSKVCSEAGADGLFADSLKMESGAVVLYAYGIKDLESGITAKFGNMVAPTAEQVAKLLVSSSENMDSVRLTKTAGLTMMEGENTGDSDDVEHLTVSLVISGNGSATGGGRFEAGQVVTLRATPDDEAEFVEWRENNASGRVLSTQNPYQFTVEENIVICAKFHGGPVPHYNISVSADPADGGTVSGGGSKEEGSTCTVVATPAEGKIFEGWFENGNRVSGNASYAFTVDRARTLVARFADQPAGMIISATQNGTPITGNGTYAAAGTIAATVDASGNGKTFAIQPSVNAPTVGQSISVPSHHATVQNGAASVENNTVSGQGRLYLLLGTVSNNQFEIEEVYQYSLLLQGGD